MEEQWKPIPIEGISYYEVSNFGRVRSVPRDVKTRLVRNGNESIIVAHRKSKIIHEQWDSGRPHVRLVRDDGITRKVSLPLLVLMAFKDSERPDTLEECTAAYIDGNVRNNNVNNLAWVKRSELMSSIASSRKGEGREDLKKYHNIIIKVGNNIVGYFKDTVDGEELFNSYGIKTSSSSIGRCLYEKTRFYNIFDFEQVNDSEYFTTTLSHPQYNLKVILDAIRWERKRKDKTYIYKDRVKVVEKKVPVEKIVYKNKIVYKDRIVYKDKKEPVKKVIKPKVQKVIEPKQTKPRNVDDWEEPTDKDIMGLENEMKKEKFMREMMKRMNIHK